MQHQSSRDSGVNTGEASTIVSAQNHAQASPGVSGGFWKPAAASSILQEDNRRNEESNAIPFNFSRAPLAQQRLMLPIYKHRRQILHSVENYGVVIIVGETGCGKSTQLPLYLYENGWCENDFQVVCTQPRRIAAQTLAKRVSEELGMGPSTVGYTVRFDDNTSDATKIKFVTDGMLLREASLHDPLLSRYSVVIIDEAHERNLISDALLGLLLRVRKKRKDLRVIVCSATIDAEAFLNFFVKKSSAKDGMQPNSRKRRWGRRLGEEAEQKNDPDRLANSGMIISVDGRQHSVDVLYLSQPTSHYVRCTVETALKIHKEDSKEKEGDILCFLPSGEDVDQAIRMAEEAVDNDKSLDHNKIVFLPLYASLPYSMQARVFQPQHGRRTTRRVIFATNLAETSVTVPNITSVIDSGFVKLPYFDPKTDFERLIVVPVSKASAQQRAGRAGRIQPGRCYRLYTEQYLVKIMEQSTLPEILRTNLTSFILTLKALGVDNILAFDMMDLPGVDALSHGLESLYALGAIDDQTNLTGLGLDMSAFPTEPRVSRMLLESLREDCALEVLAVASALQVRSLFLKPRRGSQYQQQQMDFEASMSQLADSSGDHVTYANVVAEQDDRNLDKEECTERFINYVALRRVMEIRNQLSKFLRKYGRVRGMGAASAEERSAAIRKCVTAGFFFNVAKLGNDGNYYTIRGNHSLLVTPSQSSIFHSHGKHSEYIVFGETHDGARGGIELQSVSSIDSRWLRELAPHYWK